MSSHATPHYNASATNQTHVPPDCSALATHRNVRGTPGFQDLQDGESLETVVLTSTGRVVDVVRVVCQQSSLLLIGSPGVSEALMQRWAAEGARGLRFVRNMLVACSLLWRTVQSCHKLLLSKSVAFGVDLLFAQN